jgi:DNA-binding response OmpR family regulator
MAHILIVDSDLGVHAQVKQALSRDGHQVMAATAAHPALQAIERAMPDLLIVDVALGDNLALCRRLRNAPATARLPILCLTAELSAAAALDAGSDDYLRKPFAALELAARVRALDRRARRGPFIPVVALDPDTHSALVSDRRIQLTLTEYQLLSALGQEPGIYLNATELLHRVWGYPIGVGDTALVRNHIRHLRCKIEINPARPQILLSKHKRGYTLAFEG